MAGSTPLDNPYLAHLPPSRRGAAPVSSNPSIKEPLFGFLPRKVKGDQVRKAMVLYLNMERYFSNINGWIVVRIRI